jgi:hypothetical protein
MWVLILITTAAASYVPGVSTILQTTDEKSCLEDRQKLIDTGLVIESHILCLPGSIPARDRGIP